MLALSIAFTWQVKMLPVLCCTPPPWVLVWGQLLCKYPTLCMQATSMRKDQSISQLNVKIRQAESELKKAQDRFQEEKVLLTNRETELLKAKADVRALY